MKMFVNKENSYTFAPYFAKVCFNSLLVEAFFYANTATADVVANDIGYQIPAVCYTNKDSKCTLASSGGDSLSYILLLTNKFHSQMPKYDEITNFVNNSSDVCTYSSTTTAPIGFKPQTHQSQQITNVSPAKKQEKHVSFADVLAELESHFTIEKNAKNKAYDFILQMGLLDEFQEFCLCHTRAKSLR